jgi:hypothetical protein
VQAFQSKRSASHRSPKRLQEWQLQRSCHLFVQTNPRGKSRQDELYGRFCPSEQSAKLSLAPTGAELSPNVEGPAQERLAAVIATSIVLNIVQLLHLEECRITLTVRPTERPILAGKARYSLKAHMQWKLPMTTCGVYDR